MCADIWQLDPAVPCSVVFPFGLDRAATVDELITQVRLAYPRVFRDVLNMPGRLDHMSREIRRQDHFVPLLVHQSWHFVAVVFEDEADVDPTIFCVDVRSPPSPPTALVSTV